MDNAISFAQFEMEDGFVCLPPSLIALENFTSPYGDLKLEFNCSARPKLTWESAHSLVLKGPSKDVWVTGHCGDTKTYLWNGSIGLVFHNRTWIYDKAGDPTELIAGEWKAYKFELHAGESVSFRRGHGPNCYCTIIYVNENLEITTEDSVHDKGKYLVLVSDMGNAISHHTFEFQ